ncbi:MAG: alpha/beta hydrolase [Candidatus Lokiarchaeota archaeon]|nr:alpha/beta hydrolase [Candidatus Lokiarchaeota archaeon]
MESSTFRFKTHDDKNIFVYKWEPSGKDPKAILLIIHGLAEHAGRYEDFAESATQSNYIIYAPDIRGHGKTAEGASELGVIENNGWNLILDDLHLLVDDIKKTYSKLPLFLLGHSLGSEIAQDYSMRWGNDLQGVILSGPQAQQPIYILLFGEILGKREIKKLGPKAPSKTFKKIAWEKFNKPFKPVETDYDWLSTDAKEVRKYADDNLCGWTPSTVFSTEITRGFKRTHKKSNRQLIPNELPIYVLCGSKDPTNDFTKMVKIMIKKYEKLNKKIEAKFYEGKRHELLHEINRDEITLDIIQWLDSQI